MNRAFGRHAGLAFRLQSEVDHHDGVLLDDADQQDDADQRDHIEVASEQHQRQQRADTGRGRGVDRIVIRVDETLVRTPSTM